jgi:hypothetical protein
MMNPGGGGGGHNSDAEIWKIPRSIFHAYSQKCKYASVTRCSPKGSNAKRTIFEAAKFVLSELLFLFLTNSGSILPLRHICTD